MLLVRDLAMNPEPNSVRYNDWRQVAVAPLETFVPVMPVSVIVPYYQEPAETLARTLAALEGQTYPRHLFEVIVVDDGSAPPLSGPLPTSLDVKIVRQEGRGFGLSRARNTGARAAAHDILLFLDCDLLAEASWIAAHARWHHAVSDALTIGQIAYVAVDGVDAKTIRHRSGSLRGLLADRAKDEPWTESHLARTNGLTSKADDIFRAIEGGNIGIGVNFYWSLGGFEESFKRWGMEDIELSFRAYVYGGLLTPAPDAFAWHQSRWKDNRSTKKQRSLQLQRQKAAQFLAHPGFRGKGSRRVFKVPRYVVTIDAGRDPLDKVIGIVADILADRAHDLVVRVDARASDDAERLAELRDEFGADPRVRVAPARSALDEFPASPFHVALPAAVFARNLLGRLRSGLGDAAVATATLPDGKVVSITRAWALHRARRAGGDPADYGDARTIPGSRLGLRGAGSVDYPTGWSTLLRWVRDVGSPREAWALLKGLALAVRWRLASRR